MPAPRASGTARARANANARFNRGTARPNMPAANKARLKKAVAKRRARGE